MCGIVGGLSERNVVPILLEGLSRLEYRGYDSVGIAVIDNGKLKRERVTARVKQLKGKCQQDKFRGLIGIGHTRWATHGGVSEANAHPHFSNDSLALVHNGIIENFAELKEQLQKDGYIFTSQTDTEVIVHLIHSFYSKHHNLLAAVTSGVRLLRGAYAIGVIARDHPEEIVCARFGSPLILGVGIHEMFFASDISAVLPVTQKIVYLEDGDIARLQLSEFSIYDLNEKAVVRKTNISELSATQTELGHYRHYMQKEIFEQPDAIAGTLQSMGHVFSPEIFGKDAVKIFAEINKIQIIACGTSNNAGAVAKYWFEELTGLECSVDIASEYRYRKVAVNKDSLIIGISQSGETADTLASIKYVQELGMLNTLAICNVAESSLIRLSKLYILTQAGPEIGVASTKAFTTQLIVLLYLAFTLALVKKRISLTAAEQAMQQIRKLPALALNMLAVEPLMQEIAKDFKYKQHVLFLGRHCLYPIAFEGSLKLKEISYIHAEAYAAGELKHGPLALIDKDMPVIALMPSALLIDKMKSNVEEILAREGTVYLFTDSTDKIVNKCYKNIALATIDLPDYLLPILYTIPLQLLAYHTAVAKGTDVDKPRNLAKSVTVE